MRESGPSDAESTVLLLPGGMCTAVFFEPIMDALLAAPVHVVAATLPGFGGTPHQADFSVEGYASLVGQLADELRADIVGGHRLGGNVALEMAASGEFDGPVLLLTCPALGCQARLGYCVKSCRRCRVVRGRVRRDRCARGRPALLWSTTLPCGGPATRCSMG